MTGRAEQRLRRAEAEALSARARLRDTLDLIQDELSPANLANRAIDELRGRGQSLADNALGTLLSRPILTAIAASLAGYLLQRKPGLASLARLFVGDNATGRAPKHSRSGKSKASPKAQETM